MYRKDVDEIICARHEYLETEIKAVCEGEEFRAKGSTVTSPGSVEAELPVYLEQLKEALLDVFAEYDRKQKI